MTPRSRPAFLMARVARQTRLSALKASFASSERFAGSVNGKSAIAGISSATASFAASTIRSTLRRSTPGIDVTGTRLSFPSMTNIGQMRSLGERRCSATSSRVQGALRLRRIRVAGKRPLVSVADWPVAAGEGGRERVDIEACAVSSDWVRRVWARQPAQCKARGPSSLAHLQCGRRLHSGD
ncbi:hypothetical protein HYPGJ_30164 [Hyphomicrobium sp. GJ21]|nr:hypothetical protein HYPGJ_30164 [Hyphomicrobium sp. GJ21]